MAICGLAWCVTLVPHATAQPAPPAGVIIDVAGAKHTAYPIAVPQGVASDLAASREIAEVLSKNLAIAGYFKVLDPKSFLADLAVESMGIDPAKWRDVGAYGVVKYRATTTGDRIALEFRFYEVAKGADVRLTRTYSGKKADVRGFAHQWSNELVKYLTGEPGFFGSRLAFVTKKGTSSQVFAIDCDGANATAITRNTSTNILPAWSRSGALVAFTSYMRNNPDLYVVGAGGGRPRKVASYKGMNTGASFSPDGSQLAVTLSKDGNAEIYIINVSDGSIVRRITNDRGIDTSPAWSSDGRELAFVSDRDGSPQIYVVSASGGTPKRVSQNGNYNTTPTWSPRGRVLAYTTRDGGRYDIVTLDLTTKVMARITQNEGNNEEPSFAPNGRAIAFASTRPGGAGIYIAPADGQGTAVKIWSGAATGIDWGP
ncbi:MAG: Tol-Pal system beta propeller repeat protein TolB [Myxococcales bacterium]|nr:Tol-Pal system beta propeller repeat protein TolB [Myxococcales bacterium]